MKKRVWAVIGGGHGGQTFAGHLAILGEQVRLHTKSVKKAKAINEKGCITLHHAIEGKGVIEFATTDFEKALYGASNIVIVLPSNWHEMTVKCMIPYLKDGQKVLILPEASCGAIAFRKLMKDMNCSANILVAAGNTLPYATRSSEVGDCFVHGLKNQVKIAALPATDNELLKESFCDIFPCFKVCSSVLETSIDNPNAPAHPAPLLMNVARIEANPKQHYEYYREGMTPSICKLIEEIDKERIAVADAFGIFQDSLKNWYIDTYKEGDKSMSLCELYHSMETYNGIMTPESLKARLLLEDLPYSLVPIGSLGKIAGVPTPCIDAIATIGKAILGDDLDEGRTPEKLGINKISKEEFIKYIMG